MQSRRKAITWACDETYQWHPIASFGRSELEHAARNFYQGLYKQTDLILENDKTPMNSYY